MRVEAWTKRENIIYEQRGNRENTLHTSAINVIIQLE